jgi:sugar phosphate permease
MFGMFFYLSIYLQQLQHYTPVQTGLADLPIALTIAVVAGVISRKLAGKISPKMALTIAPLVVAAGLFYLARLPIDANYWLDVLPPMIAVAAGMGVTFVMGTMQATSGVSHKEAGVVSGLLNTANQMGGAVGLAVLSVISANITKSDMAQAHGAQSALPAALVHGFHIAFATGAVFALVASAIAAFVMVRSTPTRADEARKLEVEAESLLG